MEMKKQTDTQKTQQQSTETPNYNLITFSNINKSIAFITLNTWQNHWAKQSTKLINMICTTCNETLIKEHNNNRLRRSYSINKTKYYNIPSNVYEKIAPITTDNFILFLKDTGLNKNNIKKIIINHSIHLLSM